MEGTTLLGLAVLSVLTISIAAFGYLKLSSLTDRQRLMNALEKLANVCQEVASAGGERVIELEIPAGYTIFFRENKIEAGEIGYPEEGLPFWFSENISPIPAGKHIVRVSLFKDRFLVWT